jgi:hypothetical protein
MAELLPHLKNLISDNKEWCLLGCYAVWPL